MFEEEKKACLYRMHEEDRSRKGSVDEGIKELLDLINSCDCLYTTSSCSGRIMLYTRNEKKKDTKWIFSSHEESLAKDIIFALKACSEEDVWMKQESFILHIVARDLDSAERFVRICREIGLKRVGIQTLSGRINIEAYYHLGLDMPVRIGGKDLMGEEPISKVIGIANGNIRKNKEKILRLENAFKASSLSL